MKHIGKYQICGLLGRGGMGQVFKARIPVVDKIVALKLCRPTPELLERKGTDAIVEEFTREARIMAEINHPHVAQIWDFDYDDAGSPFFVMEYHCDNLGAAIGESYRHDVPTRRLRPDHAVRYALQTLDGLARLHHTGIVHRDIKPYNLLLTELDRVKIIDFGLSRLRNEQHQAAPQGVKIGTPFYAAPEQEQAPELADHRADLFSTAVMLHRMLVGELPPETTGDPLSSEASAVLETLAAQSGADWNVFFETALAQDPNKRFADAQAMSAALEELLESWRKQQESVCVADFDADTRPDLPAPSRSIRATPVKTGPLSAQQAFRTDALARPRVWAPRFEPLPDGSLADRSCNLQWQASGSPYPVRWDEIPGYLEQLNAALPEDSAPWRLPTADELFCLVAAASDDADFCGASPFDKRQRILWSADRRTYTATWCLNSALGFLDWRDTTCRCWIRAVRELKQ